VGDIPVVHRVVEGALRRIQGRPLWVSLPGTSTLDVLDVHDVPGVDIELLSLDGASAWDIVDALLIANKSWRFGLDELNTLQFVGRVQGIVIVSVRFELDALGLGSFDVQRVQIRLRLSQTDVQLPRGRPFDVVVGEVVLLLGGLHGTRSVELRNGS